MCICEYDCNQLFCCWYDRASGVKAIGFFHFVLFFGALIWPVYELNNYRSDPLPYTNGTFVDVAFLKNGGYESLLVAAIIFFLVGLVVSALLVWAATQNYAWLFVPWLVYEVFYAALLILMPIFVIYLSFRLIWDYQAEHWKILMALVPQSLAVLSLYMWVHVKIYFDLLSRASDRIAPSNSGPRNNAINNNNNNDNNGPMTIAVMAPPYPYHGGGYNMGPPVPNSFTPSAPPPNVKGPFMMPPPTPFVQPPTPTKELKD